MTLVELLLVIGLLVMLAGLVLPVGLSRLRSAGSDEVAARVESALMVARAEAQRRGVVIEVVAEEERSGGGVFVLRGRVIRAGAAGDGDGGGEPEEQPEELAELPPGVRLVRAGDGAQPGGGGAGAVAVSTERGGEADRESRPLRVAVALPDGRVLRGAGELTFSVDGRVLGALAINTWTGKVTVRAAAESVPGTEPSEEPPETFPTDAAPSAEFPGIWEEEP